MTDITITPPEVITVTATSPTAYTITVTQPAAVTVTATSESHLPVTIGTANGLSLAIQTLSLGLASAGVTGALSGTDWSTFNSKEPAITILQASKGGTGVNNSFNLTISGTSTINGSLVGSMTGGGTVATGGFTLTVPATGTAALLATANVFTAVQKVNINSTTALVVEQDGVKDNVLVVDTTNGYVAINGTPVDYALSIFGSAALANIRRSVDLAVSGSGILLDRSRGTNAVPTTVLAGDVLGKIQFRGHNGTAYTDASFFQVVAATNFNSSVTTYFDLQTPTANIFRLSNMKVSAAFTPDEAMSTIQFFTGDDSGQRVAASIAHISDFATNHGVVRGGLQFNTSSTGAVSEAMRLTNGGLMGIGGIPTGRFQVTGTTDIIQNRTLAHSTQTANIATWESSAAAVYVSISGTGVFFPRQTTTAAAPAYVKGGMYFDTTLNKLRIGGATAWETVTSV